MPLSCVGGLANVAVIRAAWWGAGVFDLLPIAANREEISVS
jgi:hypothetical protein